ncbi:MAG: class I SAM-dependent methyltransferase [bacterium]|nr:class I SAM-dependent methyltransferase [bacterium]
MKRFATRLLLKVGLFQTVFDYYNTTRGLDFGIVRSNRRIRKQANTRDFPLPPIALVTSAAGTPSLRWFLDSGSTAAECIRDVLRRNGTEIGDLGSILDFGCGCGRVIRHLPGLTNAGVFGVDVNARAIRWCREHLAFGTFAIGDLRPKLSFADGSFDLVYAFSVFTHLPEPLQQPWAHELRRVLRPGGLLLTSLHGQSYLPDLTESEQSVFRDNKLVVRHADTLGSNHSASYHPPTYAIEHLFDEFELMEHRPEGAVGNPHQDLYLLRKPSKEVVPTGLGVDDAVESIPV